jgi:hypothetical protein
MDRRKLGSNYQDNGRMAPKSSQRASRLSLLSHAQRPRRQMVSGGQAQVQLQPSLQKSTTQWLR